MKYRVVFASQRAGEADMPPFEIDTPDSYGVGATTVELSRHIRDRVAAALTAIGHADQHTAAQSTQIVVNLSAGEGTAHYGTATIGAFNVYTHQ